MGQGIRTRYSEAFKQQVIAEIESTGISQNGIKERYGIGSVASVHGWLKKYGRNDLLNKVVRVETKDERDQLKSLKEEKQRLESALAQSQLKILALETLIDVAEEHYRVDIKKNFGRKPPSDSPVKPV